MFLIVPGCVAVGQPSTGILSKQKFSTTVETDLAERKLSKTGPKNAREAILRLLLRGDFSRSSFS